MAIITGTRVVESMPEFIVADGNISEGASQYSAHVMLDEDLARIQVGTEILIDNPPTYFYDVVTEITQSNNNIFFAHSYTPVGTMSFSFKPATMAFRHLEEVPLDDGTVVEKEVIDGYFDNRGEYVPLNSAVQSMCFINGKNSSSQTLTAGEETLVEWNDSLVWFDPDSEWKLSNDPTNPYHFVPNADGVYAVWVNFSVLATSSSVGDIIKATLSIPSPAWHFLEVVHQRPDLDFVGTFRRNVDLQGMVYLTAGQPLGVYVTSGCNTSSVSNTYTAMLSFKRLMKYTI